MSLFKSHSAVPDWKPAYPRLTEAWLTAEQGLLRTTYPQFRLVWTGEFLAFRGPLQSNYGSIFQIEVRLRPKHPEEEPHLWVLSPKLPADTEHRWQDGRICAHAEPFIPYRTTVSAMISVMAGWVFRFERRRLQGISWDDPLEIAGETLAVNSDGTLFLKSR